MITSSKPDEPAAPASSAKISYQRKKDPQSMKDKVLERSLQAKSNQNNSLSSAAIHSNTLLKDDEKSLIDQ